MPSVRLVFNVFFSLVLHGKGNQCFGTSLVNSQKQSNRLLSHDTAALSEAKG